MRIIPLLCCQKNNLFSQKDCRFNIEKCKETTARAVVFREMNIMNSFTLECSFFGKEMNKDDSLNQKDPSSKLAAKKKKLVHMSV